MSEELKKAAGIPPEIEYVECACCKNVVPKVKFCIECGSPLEGCPKADPKSPDSKDEKPMDLNDPNVNPLIGIPVSPFKPVEPVQDEEVEDDTGLTLLVDYCRKTIATVGGDGYDEIVLYKNEETGECSIHTYSKYVYMEKESHHSFKAKEGAEEAAFKLIEELKLEDYKGKTGIGLCGGDYVVKFKSDDGIVRISTGNMGMDGPSALCSVGNLLGELKVPKE